MPLPPFLSRGPSFLMDLSAEGGGGEAKDKANPTFPPSQERRRDVAGGVVVVVVAPYAPSPPSARNI